MEEGEERVLIIRDYHAAEAGSHGSLGGLLMQQLPPGSKVQWRFFYEPAMARARHIFTGDYQVIVQLIGELEQKLEEGL
jgi:glycine/D-amino acid oxidase-like deaminating enzyme